MDGKPSAGVFGGVVNFRDEKNNIVWSNKDQYQFSKSVFYNTGSNLEVNVKCTACGQESKKIFLKLISDTIFQSLYCSCNQYLGIKTKGQLKSIIDLNLEFFSTEKEQKEIRELLDKLPEVEYTKPINEFGIGGIKIN